MYEIRSPRHPVIRCPDFDATYMTARMRALRDRLRTKILQQTARGTIKPLCVLMPRAFGLEAHTYPGRAKTALTLLIPRMPPLPLVKTH